MEYMTDMHAPNNDTHLHGKTCGHCVDMSIVLYTNLAWVQQQQSVSVMCSSALDACRQDELAVCFVNRDHVHC